MSRKNDELNEIYDEYQKNADINSKTPDVSKKQGLTPTKIKEKIVTGVVIMLVGATLVGIGIKNSKDTQDPTPVTTSDTTGPTDGDTTSDYEYVLVENFDVSDEYQVSQVVSDIDSIGDFDVNIENLIYFYNGVLQRTDFPDDMSDLEIFNELQNYLLKINDIYSLGVNEYSDAISKLEKGETSDLNYNKKLITSRAIISTNSASNDYSTRLASNLNSLLKDVQNGVTTNFDKYSSEYYKIYTEVMNDDTLEVGEKAVIINDIKAKAPLYSRLTKEQRSEIDKETQALLENTLGFEMLNKLGPDFASIVAYYDDGNMGKTLTPPTEKYNGSDLSDANNYAGSTGEEDKTEKVQTGGQNVSGSASHETISEATTSKPVVSTTIVDVPTTETTTRKEQGGDPVGEPETSTETTTIIDEETSLPGTIEKDENGNVINSEGTQNDTKNKLFNALTAIGSTLAVAGLSYGSLGIVQSYSDKDKTKGNSKKKRRK